MSNFVKVIKNHKNELLIPVDITINSLGIIGLSNVLVKIDTGCAYTSIPIQKLGVSQANAQIMKQNDCNNISIRKEISFGVNDTQADRNLCWTMFKSGNYMNLKQVSFIHNGLEMVIGGIKVQKQDVKVSYDRTNNILIGMDILKNWDIHMGKDDAGQYIFLGCPYDKINDDYLKELENTFHIISNIKTLSENNNDNEY